MRSTQTKDSQKLCEQAPTVQDTEQPGKPISLQFHPVNQFQPGYKNRRKSSAHCLLACTGEEVNFYAQQIARINTDNFHTAGSRRDHFRSDTK